MYEHVGLAIETLKAKRQETILSYRKGLATRHENDLITEEWIKERKDFIADLTNAIKKLEEEEN